MESNKFGPKNSIDSLIDSNHKEIFNGDLNIVYIASVPKSLKNPDTNEFFLEVGYKNSKKGHIPIICKNGICNIKQTKTGIKKQNKHYPTTIDVLPFQFQSQTTKVRPLEYGVNIANQHLKPGTLGAIMEIKFENGNTSKYMISCHHVMCGVKFKEDIFVSQPYKNYLGYGYHPKDIVAQVKFGHFGDELDVAFACLFDDCHVNKFYLNGIAPPKGIATNPEINEGDAVYFVGAKSGKGEGILKSKKAFFRVPESDTSANLKLFKNQLLFDGLSNNGDSGSLVINSKTKKALGLLIGGDASNYFVANNLNYIFSSKIDYGEKLPKMEFIKFI